MRTIFAKTLLSIMAWCAVLPLQASSAALPSDDGRRFVKQLLPHARKVSLLSSSNRQGEVSAYCGRQGEGFVIVGGDGQILGYSTTGTLNRDSLPPALERLLGQYQPQSTGGQSARKATPHRWKHRPTQVVAPLLHTKWGQNYPFNGFTPLRNGRNAPTGCVATAMAQVMCHHRWPTARPSFDSYAEGTDPTVVGSTYRWEQMLDTYSGTGITQDARDAVAVLMRDAGMGARMVYKANESSAQMGTACNSLADDFGYHTQFVNRAAYATTELIGMMTEELKAGRPILFSGKGNGGHAFVCDGIDSNDMLSMNWGWEGQGDGFYHINLLLPSVVGTGGGGGDFSYNQELIFLCPNKGNASPYADIGRLMAFGEGSYLYAPTPQGSTSEVFQVVAHEVGNATSKTGMWNVALAVSGDDGRQVDFQSMQGSDGTLVTRQLGQNTFTDMSFSMNLSKLPDGDYTLRMYGNYVEKGTVQPANWQPVQNARTLKISVSQGMVSAVNPPVGIRLAMAVQPQELMRAYNNYHAGITLSVQNQSGVVARGDLEMQLTSVKTGQAYTIPLNCSAAISDGDTESYACQYTPSTTEGRLPDGDYTAAFYMVSRQYGQDAQRHAIENPFGPMTIKLRPRLSGGYLEYQHLDFFRKGSQTPEENFSRMDEEIELMVKVKNISFSTYRNPWMVRLQDTEQGTLYNIGEYSQPFVGEVHPSFTFIPQRLGLQAGRLYRVVLEGKFADGETSFWNAHTAYRYVMFGHEGSTPTGIAQQESGAGLHMGVQHGMLVIRSPFAIRGVTVCDVSGRKVLETLAAGADSESIIPVGNLPRGVYLVSVKTSNENICRKMLLGQ